MFTVKTKWEPSLGSVEITYIDGLPQPISFVDDMEKNTDVYKATAKKNKFLEDALLAAYEMGKRDAAPVQPEYDMIMYMSDNEVPKNIKAAEGVIFARANASNVFDLFYDQMKQGKKIRSITAAYDAVIGGTNAMRSLRFLLQSIVAFDEDRRSQSAPRVVSKNFKLFITKGVDLIPILPVVGFQNELNTFPEIDTYIQSLPD